VIYREDHPNQKCDRCGVPERAERQVKKAKDGKGAREREEQSAIERGAAGTGRR
jgi:hypothetical protein